MDNKFTVIVYHKGCKDGYACAYLANKIYGNKVKYIPLSYYDKVPSFKNENILVCDFSFEYKDVQKILKNNKLFIIDHHKTAFEKLENLDDKHKHLDLNHSGAYLTWKYFYPKKKTPLYIKLIEDYDLWKFKYDETKPFMLALDQIPYNFNRWSKLEDNDYVNNLVQKGKIIKLYQDSIIKRAIYSYRTCNHEIDGVDYKVIYKNSSCCVNEIANELVQNYRCDFAVCYHYDDKKNITRFNLRSIDSKADVSMVARFLGGGGHRNASGLTKRGFHNSII